MNGRWRSQASNREMSRETFCSANLCDTSFIFNPNFKFFRLEFFNGKFRSLHFQMCVCVLIKGYVWDHLYSV